MTKHFDLKQTVSNGPAHDLVCCAHPSTRSVIKRGIDLTAALLVLAFFSPLMLLIAGLIIAESPGPVLFRQRRTGLHGRTFQIYKFRTMKVVEDGAEIRHASRCDARVTRVGAFLRRTHWDEIPQVLNIIAGDMSLIGPRPHAVAHDQLYGEALANYGRRFLVRPGLTGLAQVRGHRGEVFDLSCMRQRLAADLDYVQGWSKGLDLKIAVETLPLLISDSKSY